MKIGYDEGRHDDGWTMVWRVVALLVGAFILTAVLARCEPVQAHPRKSVYLRNHVTTIPVGVNQEARLASRMIHEAGARWERLNARWEAAHQAEVLSTVGDSPVDYGSSGSALWDAVAACEGGGNWALFTTGNGYYFVLQFHPQTWLAYGGTQAELDAGVAPSRERLIQVAEAVLAGQGPGAWPNCFPS